MILRTLKGHHPNAIWFLWFSSTDILIWVHFVFTLLLFWLTPLSRRKNPPASLLTAMGRSKTSSLIARPAFQRGQPRKLALHFAPNPPTLLTGATSDCGLYSSHNSSSSNLHGSMSNLNSSCQAAASGSNGAVQNSGRFAYYLPQRQLSLNQFALWIWTAFG